MSLARSSSESPNQQALDHFFSLIKNGELALLQSSIAENPAKAFWRDELKRTPLIVAARYGRLDLVHFLLPFEPLATDEYGRTALMSAGDRLECVKALLPVSNAQQTDRFGCSALMLAAHHGYDKVMELLLPYSDLTQTDSNGHNALFLAAQDACIKTLDLLCEHDRAWFAQQCKSTNANGLTPLQLLASTHHLQFDTMLDCVRLLLPDSHSTQLAPNGTTTLMLAAQHLDRLSVSFLRQFVDAKAVNHQGQTALMLAVNGDNIDNVKELLPHSDVRAVDSIAGRNALMLAVDNPNRSLDDGALTALLLPHSDPFAVDRSGHTALTLAAQQTRPHDVVLLVNARSAAHRIASGEDAFELVSQEILTQKKHDPLFSFAMDRLPQEALLCVEHLAPFVEAQRLREFLQSPLLTAAHRAQLPKTSALVERLVLQTTLAAQPAQPPSAAALTSSPERQIKRRL